MYKRQIQRSLIDSVSTTDGNEAELVGKSAVTESLKGSSNIMITLIRESNDPYSVTTSTTSLDKIAGKVRKLPRNFYPSEDFLPSAKFIEYLNPLIGTPIDRINRLL